MKRPRWMYILGFLFVVLNYVLYRHIFKNQKPIELSEEMQQCLIQFNGTKDSLYPRVQMNTTQVMGMSLIDGYTMCATCMASVSKGDVHMRWDGKGLNMSLWANQFEAETHRHCFVRKLCFSPWLNSQAGKYTCYVTVKGDANFTVTMEQSVRVYGEFRGMTNSRDVSQKFDTSPVKPSKWFPNTNLCAEDDVWQKYADFHASVLSGKHKAKYLIYDCTNSDPKFECGGYGNRIHGITVLLMLSMLTKHVFLIQMTNPVDINDYLLPNAIQWNHTLPEGLESRYVDLFNKKNFYENYKPLEAALLGGDDDYDAIRVRLDFGLFYFLVTMSNTIFNGLVSTFNLKSQYDVAMLNGCVFNYLFQYRPEIIQGIESLQTELSLETGKFVALHVRSHIDDNSVFNPLNLDFPYTVMFECAKMAANSLKNKLKVSKVPIYFTTDHSTILEYVKENYDDDSLVFSRAPIFHVDHTKYEGDQASSQYNSGMIGVLSDIEICSRAAVLVRSADSTFSEMMGAIHFLRPQYNLHPFYFYENLSLCRL